MRRTVSRRKRARDRIRRRKQLEMDERGRPDSRMGDLHLRQYGIDGRAGQRMRRRLKQTSARMRRRHSRQISRQYLDGIGQ